MDRRITTKDRLGGDQVVNDWLQIGFPVLRSRGVVAGVEDVELLGEHDQRFRVLVLELINDALVDEVVEVVLSSVDLPDGLEDIVLPPHGVALILDLAEGLHSFDLASCDVLLVHIPEIDHGVVEKAVGLRNGWEPGALASHVGVAEGDVEKPVELVHLWRELSCISVHDVMRSASTDM